MNATPLLIAMVLGSGVILGLYSYYNDINIIYAPSDVNTTTKVVFSAFNKTFTEINQLSADISNKTSDIASKGLLSWSGVQDSVAVFFDVATLLTKTPAMVVLFIDNLFNGMPIFNGGEGGWFIAVLTIVIVLTIVSLIASILLKRVGSEI